MFLCNKKKGPGQRLPSVRCCKSFFVAGVPSSSPSRTGWMIISGTNTKQLVSKGIIILGPSRTQFSPMIRATAIYSRRVAIKKKIALRAFFSSVFGCTLFGKLLKLGMFWIFTAQLLLTPDLMFLAPHIQDDGLVVLVRRDRHHWGLRVVPVHRHRRVPPVLEPANMV